MKYYHNPRCSKSRQSLAILEEAGAEIEIVRYLDNPPTQKELTSIIQKLGIKPYDLIRRNEAIFKEKYKGKDLTDSQWIKAMVEHPKLIERPILVTGNKAIIGRPPEKILSIL